MYRSARPLFGLGLVRSAAAAKRPQTFTRAAFPSTTTARRLPVAAFPSRSYSNAPDADMRLNARLQKQYAAKSDKGYSAKEVEAAQLQQMSQILLPGTFVHLPFDRLDKSPGPLLKYLFNRYKQHIKDLATIVGLKFQSMPKLWVRPTLKVQRRQIVPTAKALHHRMNQALASGDKDTLREICIPRLYDTLSSVISRRKANQSITWELIKHNRSPKVVSHRVAPLPPLGKSPIIQQAVVAISSEQKLGRVDKKTGQPVGDSKRIQNETEYFVIMRQIHPKTYEPKKWQIWGSTQPMTAEDWELEEKGLKQMERQDFARRRGVKL